MIEKVNQSQQISDQLKVQDEMNNLRLRIGEIERQLEKMKYEEANKPKEDFSGFKLKLLELEKQLEKNKFTDQDRMKLAEIDIIKKKVLDSNDPKKPSDFDSSNLIDIDHLKSNSMIQDKKIEAFSREITNINKEIVSLKEIVQNIKTNPTQNQTNSTPTQSTPAKISASEIENIKKEILIDINKKLAEIEVIKKELSFENEKLGTFLQEYVNEQAKFKLKKIKQIELTTKQKMDYYEWFVRNIEFISPSIPTELLNWTKENLGDAENNPNKLMLTTSKHDSDVF